MFCVEEPFGAPAGANPPAYGPAAAPGAAGGIGGRAWPNRDGWGAVC